jgi:putative acetyltransferase
VSDGLQIRREISSDRAAIGALVGAAFKGGAEVLLVDRLREEGDLALSLVATRPEPKGYLAFSPLHLPDAASVSAWALGPLAVLPSYQRACIGTALVREGLRQAQEAGIDLVLVLGEPGYYGRFGFSASAATPFKTAYDGPFLQALHLSSRGAGAHGAAIYPRAFADLA